jgi:hypothetical protein
VEALGNLLDYLNSQRGIRAEVTIFGDVSYSPAVRSSIVDAVIGVVKPRPWTVLSVEIVNEAEALKPTQFPVAEARAYAARVRAALPNLVFVSSPAGDLCDAQQRIAGGLGLSGIEPHYSRATSGTKGVWTPATQPWMGDGRFCGGVGPVTISGEPIGPGASVNSDSDSTRLATMVLVGGVGGLAGDVFHSGPGVRGMADPSRGVVEHFSDIPNLADILEAGRQARALLNMFADLQDWTRGKSTDGPFAVKDFPDDSRGFKGTVDRVYCSWSGPRSLCVPVNVKATTTFTAKAAMHVSIRHARRALEELRAVDLAAGQSFTLGPDTAGAGQSAPALKPNDELLAPSFSSLRGGVMRVAQASRVRRQAAVTDSARPGHLRFSPISIGVGVSQMFGLAAQQFEVLNRVVGLVPVAMMNHLGWQQRPSDRLRHHPSMLEHVAATTFGGDPKHDVAASVHVFAAFPLRVGRAWRNCSGVMAVQEPIPATAFHGDGLPTPAFAQRLRALVSGKRARSRHLSILPPIAATAARR